MMDQNLDDLLSRWMSDDLSEEEFAVLQRTLETDPSARLRLRQHAALDELLREQGPVSVQTSNILDGIASDLSALDHSRTDSLSPTKSSMSWFYGGGLFACIAIGLVLYMQLMSGQDSNEKAGREIAAITAATKSEKSSNPVGSFQNEAGVATIGLDNVGTVVITGPSDFEMVNPKYARLKKGRIQVRVTEETGYGFQVETPNGVVTDLGTEFLLNVSVEGKTDLAVIEGKVDFQASTTASENQLEKVLPVERLVQGEGVKIDGSGNVDRIMSIFRSNAATFHSGVELSHQLSNEVIVKVSDNLKKSETKKFYEIIPGGFKEDVSRCVDREQAEWNGVDAKGLPKYLIGADYIKNFGDDVEQSKLEIYVTIGRPAKLYVFYDERLSPPNWLKKDFRKTGDRVASDAGRYRWSDGRMRESELGVGPGVSIDDRYSVWERVVEEPGVVTLGAVKYKSRGQASIYGIAAVALDRELKEKADETVKKVKVD